MHQKEGLSTHYNLRSSIEAHPSRANVGLGTLSNCPDANFDLSDIKSVVELRKSSVSSFERASPEEAVSPKEYKPEASESTMELIHGKADKQRPKTSTKALENDSKPRQEQKEEIKMMADVAKLNALSIRFNKFKSLLELANVDLEQLRKLSWSGIPEEIRPTVWKLLMSYLPANLDRREATLSRKRKEYEEFIAAAYSRGPAGLDSTLHHQIQIDIKRTNAGIFLYQSPITQQALERVLYVWAIRHPASGYVQGINDILTPFFQVFLQEYTDTGSGEDIEQTDMTKISPENIICIEADCYWCLTKLLDGIQDNYTHGQPGIQRQIARMKELINRIDAPLSKHLEQQGVEFVQFAFRWMNCMLMRELPLKATIRMWDSYQSDGQNAFSEFHIYVCAAFLIKQSAALKKMEFQDIMMHLQRLDTSNWGDKEIELLLSEAFMWKSLFHNSQAHLKDGGGSSPHQ